jgi:hypothetical protein
MGAVIIVSVNGRILAPWKSAGIEEGDGRDGLFGGELLLVVVVLKRGRGTMAGWRMKVILYDRREGGAPMGMERRRRLRKRKRMIRMSQMREGPLVGGRRKEWSARIVLERGKSSRIHLVER